MSQRTFALTVNGELFLTLVMDSEANPKSPMWIAGLQSDPKVIDITDEPQPVDYGWKLIDGRWVAPE